MKHPDGCCLTTRMIRNDAATIDVHHEQFEKRIIIAAGNAEECLKTHNNPLREILSFKVRFFLLPQSFLQKMFHHRH